jgi:2-keto-4-pentenoate hydratase/2-oxohepta-3-ene-1,7-dioic acid hydratase in catechol pathway
MKLVTFTHNNQTRVGAVINDTIIDSLGCPEIPDSMIKFLSAGPKALFAMQNLINKGNAVMALNEVKLNAPVPRPEKYLGISLNYADHIAETGREQPKISDKLDYEGELAFVIGKRCRYVSIDMAHQVIAGFTIANDVSVRDWQMHSPTMMIGKSFDTCGPIGPWIITPDELTDPHNLYIRTWIDDELRQDANTRQMIFNCYEMIAYLSQAMTLNPGDVITTGTPSGVGVKMQPRGYMKSGQIVRIEIEGIGTLFNPIIDEPDSIIVY